MKKWHIEWSTAVPRQQGWDEIEAENIAEVRRIYAARYPRRYLDAVSLIETPPPDLALARVE
jgi:hypothetical protein